MDASALRALKRDLLKRVGELAAGWNAGAQKLGVKLPAWVARHGSKRSSAAVLNTFRVFRIILTNAVKYVTNVRATTAASSRPSTSRERRCCGGRSSF